MKSKNESTVVLSWWIRIWKKTVILLVQIQKYKIVKSNYLILCSTDVGSITTYYVSLLEI